MWIVDSESCYSIGIVVEDINIILNMKVNHAVMLSHYIFLLYAEAGSS